MSTPHTQTPNVRISILNWNKAETTIRCIHSLAPILCSTQMNANVHVVDNGSDPIDFRLLKNLILPSIELTRFERNQGFAAGHNFVIKQAIMAQDDYIFVLNNDTLVAPNALSEMINVMQSDPHCGAVSPVIVEQALHTPASINFIGSYHDWANLLSVRLTEKDEVLVAESTRPLDMWVVGTAVLYRVSSLIEVGGFNENLFAYYEDNDLGARLSSAGWKSRMAFDATVTHSIHKDMYNDRPEYYFYLMTRNAFLFWIKHSNYRKRFSNKLRLLARSLWMARELVEAGFPAKRDACLQGLLDGWKMKGGEPCLNQRIPGVLKYFVRYFPYRIYALLNQNSKNIS